MAKATILVADDELGIRNMLKRVLESMGHRILLAEHGKEALDIYERELPDLLLCDIMMPEMDGLEVLEAVHKIDGQAQVIMLTAVDTAKTALKAMELGAFRYVTKPFDLDELKAHVTKALEVVDVVRTNRDLQEEMGLRYGLDHIVGKDQCMVEIYDLIRTVAATPSTVLIRGESGTGKELIAGGIHHLSPRRNKRFIKVNCAAISEELLESELFGHEKGSFTGAIRQHEGKFIMADGGTILLDEVSEMSPKLQAKLLRVLQEKEVDRVGGREPISVDVRVLATTNRDLEKAISEGTFREDLYYRLNVVTIEFPPLRERRSDIALLTKHFLSKYNQEMNKRIEGIDRDAEQALLRYHWPGNVRQLENAIERAVVLCSDTVIGVKHLPPDVIGGDGPTSSSGGLGHVGMTVAEMERELILKTLGGVDNNRTRAAEMLGISIRTLRNKLHEYRESGHFDD